MYERKAAPLSELGCSRAQPMGGTVFDSILNVFKTGSDVYQAQKNAAAAATGPVVAPPAPGFLDKYGTVLLLSGIGVGVFLFFRHRKH